MKLAVSDAATASVAVAGAVLPSPRFRTASGHCGGGAPLSMCPELRAGGETSRAAQMHRR
eukprot:CAMPEP_0179165250 /NCGR_PEP_ID=MMETSP0796-20121207/81151_1 /TAXON_ID=73915 /ORGANISM="Pyrodinium bahamense, Strain pbaha01" /LENGTH=59 /DNA_ID=CAMNT_0020867791 /DNA_START=24 /DNA_END=199 /DNA_ORIENTATION=+